MDPMKASQYSPGGIGQVYVRVTGLRLGRFVEFEFSINDKDLTIEMILPIEAFAEFCFQNRAKVGPANWEEILGAGAGGRPGLYRVPASRGKPRTQHIRKQGGFRDR